MKLGLGLGLDKSGSNVIYNLQSPSPQTIATDYSFDGFSAEINFSNTGNPDSAEYLFQLYGDANNHITVSFDITESGFVQVRMVSGGVSQITTGGDADYSLPNYIADQGQTSVGIAVDSSSFRLYFNGVYVGRAENYTLPSGNITAIGVGQDQAGTAANILADNINRFRFYNKKLIDAQAFSAFSHSNYGISPTSDPDGLLITTLGQSNDVASVTTSRVGAAYKNTNKQIWKDGVVRDYAEEQTGSGIFTGLNQGSNGSYRGVLMDHIAEQTSKLIYCSPINKNATSLADSGSEWNVEKDGGNDWIRVDFLAYIATQMERVAKLSCPTHYARVWNQGESDANNGVTEAQYETALDALLNYLNIYNNVGLTVLGGLHDAPAVGYANWAQIDSALQDTATARSDCIYVSKAGLDVVTGDDVHLEYDGQLTAGWKFANAILTQKGEIVSDRRYFFEYHVPLLAMGALADEENITYNGSNVITAFSTNGESTTFQDQETSYSAPEFESAGFNSKDCIVGSGVAQHLKSGTITAGAAKTSIFTTIIPNSSGNLEWFTWGFNDKAKLGTLTTPNNLRYRNNEADAIETIDTGGTIDGTNRIITAIYESSSDIAIRIDGTETDTFDPHDNYSTQTYFTWGSGSLTADISGYKLRSMVVSNVAIKTNLLGILESQMAIDAGFSI